MALTLTAAGSSVVLWDHVTTFDQEIEFIWLRKWTFTTLLYIVTRYAGNVAFMRVLAALEEIAHLCLELLQICHNMWASGKFLDKMYVPNGRFHDYRGLTFVTDRSTTRCPGVLQVVPWLNQIALLATNAIMVKRVVCMSGSDKRVFWTLAFTLAVFTLYSAIVTILTSKVQSVVGRIQSRNLYEVCYIMPAGSVPFWYWTFAILMLVFDALVLGLSIFQGIRFACENRLTQQDGTRAGILEHLWRTRRTLASVLLRDSIMFPFIRLVMAILIIVAWTTKLQPGSAEGIMVAAAATVPTLGCRLLLNLRSTYYKPFREEYFQSQLHIGSLVFPSRSLASAVHE
ncbi:hypothetical protein BKA70DRAFT_1431557 [Coprinopsis sp. MPI-PUGE-AT-0042]|nr:hypothetical protein BKA70DRAFT_1431557 [Coprinopsis sp. MPI-PUGE-AT-0042]